MRWLAALLVAFIIAGAVLYLLFPGPSNTAPVQNLTATGSEANQPSPTTSTQDGNSNQAAIDNAAAAPATSPTLAPAIEPPAIPFLLGSASTPPSMSPEVVLGKMRTVIYQYGSMFGGNPVGTNREITEALNGGNPKQARFISEESGLRINGRGELVDSWGTPFFFHQLSGTEMEIRSAGPDRKMWTADDLVTK